MTISRVEDAFRGGCRAESFRNRVECHHLHGYTSKAYATNWSYVLFNTGIVFVAPSLFMSLFLFSGD